MDKRKRFVHPSPERYTKEGTANVCVHDRERFKMCEGALARTTSVWQDALSICNHLRHLSSPQSLLEMQRDLQVDLTFARKTQQLYISCLFLFSDPLDTKIFKRILMEIHEFLMDF